MPGANWCFTDEDKARLDPVLQRALAKANEGALTICEIASTVEGRIRLLQGYCEALGERMAEDILEQVDRGEWAARGINKRADVSITVVVDAAGAMLGDAQLLSLSMQPTEQLS